MLYFRPGNISTIKPLIDKTEVFPLTCDVMYCRQSPPLTRLLWSHPNICRTLTTSIICSGLPSPVTDWLKNVFFFLLKSDNNASLLLVHQLNINEGGIQSRNRNCIFPRFGDFLIGSLLQGRKKDFSTNFLIAFFSKVSHTIKRFQNILLKFSYDIFPAGNALLFWKWVLIAVQYCCGTNRGDNYSFCTEILFYKSSWCPFENQSMNSI